MKFGNKKLGYIMATSLFLFIGYETYEAFYPSDDFYEVEFKDITGLELKTAELLKSDASYPDSHGDYCSAALIKLEEEEYRDLLAKIQADSRFNGQELIGSIQLSNVTDGEKLDFLYKASRYGEPDEYYFIGFLTDYTTILIQKCST